MSCVVAAQTSSCSICFFPYCSVIFAAKLFATPTIESRISGFVSSMVDDFGGIVRAMSCPVSFSTGVFVPLWKGDQFCGQKVDEEMMEG